jgi:hypothetical protein
MQKLESRSVSIVLGPGELVEAGESSEEEQYTYIALRNTDGEIHLDLDVGDVQYLCDYLNERLKVLTGK